MSSFQTPFPVLPPELVERGIVLRPQRPEDESFLALLYMVNRWPEMEQSGWTEEEKKQFLFQQFTFQNLHYTRYYADSAWCIVEKDATAIGRLLLLQMKEELRIVDIILMPQFRQQGIGTALLGMVFAQARANRSRVSIHVELFNPARNLYDRMGFVQVSVNGVYALMQTPILEESGEEPA